MTYLPLRVLLVVLTVGGAVGCGKNLSRTEPFNRYVGQEVTTSRPAIFASRVSTRPIDKGRVSYTVTDAGGLSAFMPEYGHLWLPAGTKFHIKKIERVVLKGWVVVELYVDHPETGERVKADYSWPVPSLEQLDGVYEVHRYTWKPIAPAIWEPDSTPAIRAPTKRESDYLPLNLE